MPSSLQNMFLCLIPCLCLGCATTRTMESLSTTRAVEPAEEEGPKLPKSAKTLFAWQTDPEAEDETEGPEEPDVIATDRPDFTEASSTVGKGRIQLEAGYTFSRNRDHGVQNAHSYPEALLRVGMFAEWFEFRIGQNFSNTRNTAVDGPNFATNGGEDLYLGAKLGLTEQKGAWAESALILQMTVPTGPKDLTNGKTCPGLNYLFGWDVIPDRITAGGSVQGNAAVDDDGRSYLELAQSFTIGYVLTEKLGAYTEVFGIEPHGATAANTLPQYYFDGGFTYKFTNNFQYDIRGGVGLNKNSDDFFVGTGFAVKY